MQSTLLFAIASVLALQRAPAQEKRQTQVQRGQELFEKSAKGIACATCHQVKNIGTAVGPDLTKLASVVGPHGLVKTIQMQSTEYVQEVKTADGKTFVGIQKQKQSDELQIWNLSQMPPKLLTLASKDVSSITRETKWKHPPTSAGYTSQELADIIGFLKWASTGSRTEIKIEDVEDAK
jgi:putative heme-binding domain-containing protein